ncbi:hypothetical protein HDV02_003848 [Globomyces sp. JEL0801]|nr:hypothetical protein HDV02_003848 [Globomyces sp. JEL0801]
MNSNDTSIQNQVDEVIVVMEDNLQRVYMRQEKLEDLNLKSAELEQKSKQFKKGAKVVKKQVWWK